MGLTYDNPTGGRKMCLNTKIASCELRVELPEAPRELRTQTRAAFELLTDGETHGVPVALGHAVGLSLMTTFPGSITDVAGLAVGHFTDSRRPTGCTVVLRERRGRRRRRARRRAGHARDRPAVAGATRVEQVHAVLLAGGSAFGLDAAGGVMRWLDERGIGRRRSATGARADRAGGDPVRPLARRRADPPRRRRRLRRLRRGDDASRRRRATSAPAPARMVGKLFGIERAMKGGIGTASVKVGGVTVGALVAVNAIGDVVDPAHRRARRRRAQRRRPRACRHDARRWLAARLPPSGGRRHGTTTIGVVATDAVLDQGAGDASWRRWRTTAWRACIDPLHTPSDGDTLFALATGASGRPAD